MKASISYKLRVRPEDFQVEEIASPPLAERGDYRFYELRKRGWNTIDLLHRLARRLRVPYDCIAYGGRKDRHALTTQHISIRDPRNFAFEEADYGLRFLGFAERPMGPDLIEGNRFLIRLRWMKPADAEILGGNASEIRREGLPNYFDDQRFGGWDRELGLPGERLLHNDAESALKIYLTLVRSSEPGPAKQRKYRLRELWGDWPACLKLLEKRNRGLERRLLEFLQKSPEDWRGAVNLLPAEELSLWLAAAQSRVWNRAAARLVISLAEQTRIHPGKAGDYVFYHNVTSSALRRMRSLEMGVPGPGAEQQDSDGACTQARRAALDDLGLAEASFDLPWLQSAYFSSWSRSLIVEPDGFVLYGPAPDDAFSGRLTASLSFALPRGSFGAMVVKRATMLPV